MLQEILCLSEPFNIILNSWVVSVRDLPEKPPTGYICTEKDFKELLIL